MRWAFVLVVAALLLAVACADEARAPQASLTSAPVTRSTSSVPSAPGTVPATVPPGLTEATVTHVVDGDTIDVRIDGTKYTVRYIGIDTPETVRPFEPVECFGPEASARNKALVEGKTVGLEKDVSETDDFGRLLRYVWLGGELVNEALVRDGYAESASYPPDTGRQEQLDAAEDEARLAGRGVWSDACAATATATPLPTGTGGPGTCEYSGTTEAVIKGNIASDGERIYHVPGQENYDITVITEAKGERWFCTEAEAIAAGWRKAQR